MSLTRTESLPPRQTRSRPASPKSNAQTLRRYGSTGNYRLRLRSSVNGGYFKKSPLTFPALRVPMEMLEEIIQQYGVIELAPAMAENGHIGSQKAAFQTLFASLTLVSKDIRHLALREFFRILVFSTTEDSTSLLRFLDLLDAQYAKKGWIGGYRWVRFLSSPSFLIPPNIKCLQNLDHLQELRIDFSHSGLILQRSCIGQLFTSLATTQNAVQNLTSLKLTELPRIDAQLLVFVARGLPNLVYLHCTSTEGLDIDCCPNCYEDSLSRINHSPVPDIFPDVIHLANAFGSALAPLKKLTHIFFGIFLSPSNMLDRHTYHGASDASDSPVTFETVYNCGRCLRYESITRLRELLTSLLIAHHLESLKTVGWSSCFGTPCSDINEKDKTDNTIEDVLQGGRDYRTDVRLFSNFACSSLVQRKQIDIKEVRQPCSCEGHGFTTTFSIDRALGKIKVSREL